MSYKKAADSVGDLMKSLKKEAYARKAEGLHWADYVGDKIAANSTVVDINKGLLLVHCVHSSFANLIRLKQPEILAKLNKNYPSLQVKQVVIKVVDKPAEQVEVKKTEPSPLTTNEVPRVDPSNNTSFTMLLERLKKRANGEE